MLNGVGGRLGWGAASGAAATTAMTGLMLASQRLGLMGRQPPAKITDAALRRMSIRPRSPWREVGATALHFAFGTGLGALFGGVAGSGERRRRGLLPAVGAAFGLGVWLVSYLGWVPALRIMPPAPHDRPGRPLSMVLAHLVYGGLLGELVGRRRG